MLSKKKAARNGNTLMYHKILQDIGPISQILGDMTDAIDIWQPTTFPPVVLLEAWKSRAPDILFGIGSNSSTPTLDFLHTDQYCELVYHELSHASHYSSAGVWFWAELGHAELKNPKLLAGSSYGPCCTQYSSIIALAEGWAYHMGHYLANKKWGLQSTTFPEQGDFATGTGLLYFSNGGGFSSHVNFLEGFNPNRTVDPNSWIPKGLFNDLMDGGSEPFGLSQIVTENVVGYSNSQFYQVLQPNIRSPQEFKDKLLSQNAFWQQNEVNILFAQYHY